MDPMAGEDGTHPAKVPELITAAEHALREHDTTDVAPFERGGS
jgi:hypothetical protein